MPQDSDSTFLDEVVRICGSTVALQLVAAFGGGSVYFAQNAAEHQNVAKVIGVEHAERIAKEVGFGRQWVPCQDEALVSLVRSARRESVRNYVNEGKSRAWIARQLRCTQRTVFRDIAWLRERELIS